MTQSAQQNRMSVTQPNYRLNYRPRYRPSYRPSYRQAYSKYPLHFRSHGITLVEVLVTLLVISVGLLGIAALHLTGLRNNFDANIRSQASILASDIADRMRSNRAAALATPTSEYAIATVSTYATPSTRAQSDIAEWKTSLSQLLPNGDGSISVNTAGGSNLVTIIIGWEERGTGNIAFTTLTEL
jgi:type IV pilus assembly protein PilV